MSFSFDSLPHTSQLYLKQYLDTLDSQQLEHHRTFSAEYFCHTPELALQCALLVIQGIKTATCCLKHWYDLGEESGTVGHLQVVTDFDLKPLCIIEYTQINFCKFFEVDESFAYAEGEGDRSLDFWSRVHWDFFNKECVELPFDMHENIDLMQIHFKLVHEIQS